MNKVKLLDCTLRDGGYLNDWNFGKKAIKGTAERIAQTGVEFFEIGFIKEVPFDENRTVFPSVESIVPFITPKSPSMTYLGMIDCKCPPPLDSIPDYDGTSVDGLRVIFKKDRIDFAYDYCREIKKKGYKLFVQFVGTDSYSDIEFVETIQKFNSIMPYAMSIVDTFGTIKRKQFLRLVYLADNNMEKNITLGYHAHNNLQQAFGNAVTMVEMNLNREICIDACVFGMGRGAGNLNLELFADHMNENYGTGYKIEPMLEIMDDYLNEIYSRRFWGYCLPYYLSATNGCHPNYAIYLEEKHSLTEKSFNEILKSIPPENRRNYKKEDAEKFYKQYMDQYVDDRGAVEKLKESFFGKDV
ncbi:MAG: aldolase catalytic domain-containing protein, partial [Treponema sp.]|nr:aldolase catalytic domain-containing protein [Treponema sp.]